jgi:UDPglucose 6-dehydrogenase
VSGKNVVVVGLGYVGLSLAVLLARHNPVTAVDLSTSRVDAVNNRVSPIDDEGVSRFLAHEKLNLRATTDAASAYPSADVVIVATPTNYDPDRNSFDTSSVESVIRTVTELNPAALIVVKSTVPVGFTDKVRAELGIDSVVFSPEFLREGSALYDNLHPSRIVVGERSDRAAEFAGLLLAGAESQDIPIVLTGSTEAEAIKLFANTYLATRVAFFNELDTFAISQGLDAREIIEGVSLDPRIGSGYNNPSFGYGGYCLPKDTKQLMANYREIPQSMIRATVESNELRKDFIAADIARLGHRRVGVYRLIMKAGSDNFRESSVLGIIDRLQRDGIEVVIFEPSLDESEFDGTPVAADFASFVAGVDVIVANRVTDDLAAAGVPIYTRDLFGDN